MVVENFMSEDVQNNVSNNVNDNVNVIVENDKVSKFMNGYGDDIVHEVHFVRKTPMNTKKVTEEVMFVGKSKNKSSKTVISNKM